MTNKRKYDWAEPGHIRPICPFDTLTVGVHTGGQDTHAREMNKKKTPPKDPERLRAMKMSMGVGLALQTARFKFGREEGELNDQQVAEILSRKSPQNRKRRRRLLQRTTKTEE